jgi:hypothetical protein
MMKYNDASMIHVTSTNNFFVLWTHELAAARSLGCKEDNHTQHAAMQAAIAAGA